MFDGLRQQYFALVISRYLFTTNPPQWYLGTAWRWRSLWTSSTRSTSCRGTVAVLEHFEVPSYVVWLMRAYLDGYATLEGKGGKGGVWTDPVEHRLRRGTALPAASGRIRSVLRGRHSGFGRIHTVRGLGLGVSPVSQGLQGVGGNLVLRQEQARESAAR